MKAIASNQTITWFNQRFKEDSLELSPDFQRYPVWLQPQKEYLIETIMLELPMPEIYMVNRITPSGDSKYVVVDGQQRLRTIIEFINEELVIKHTLESFKHVTTFKDLTDDEKQKFWRYPIVVRDLEDSTDSDIRGLFQRLNKYSVALNEQELRNARFKGEYLQAVQKLGEHDFWASSGVFSANDFRRMLDLEFISILLTTLIAGIFNRKERLDEFYAMYEDEFEESNFYNDNFNKILDVIDMALPNIKKTRWKNKADFFSLFIAVANLGVKKSDAQVVAQLEKLFPDFANKVEKAKIEPDEVEGNFREYLDAATYGTNDKEKRQRRVKILSEYLETSITAPSGS
ncbi:MAG: DUF262 domain-containing protein [Sedimentisphaerales bacterium]|nr:DUF262 domain-containing protein [Sedimentisphaerales bacterium]